MTDMSKTAALETYYAAVGTDGCDAVVWGIGATTQAAVADAEAQEVDCGPLCTVTITAGQRALIEMGVVDCATLAIALSASDSRAIWSTR